MIKLVLLPGMDGTGDLFAPLIAQLGKNIDVIVVSYPLTGIDNYQELEMIARQSLPAEGDFVILGESFSGPIAISIAASKPRGLVGLILCCSFARNPQTLLRPLSPFLRFLPVKLVPNRFIHHRMLGRYATPQLKIMLNSAIAKLSSETLQARGSSVLRIDVTDKLKTIDVPCIYLRALEDIVVPNRATEHVLQSLPSIKIHDFPAPHLLLQVRARETAIAISAFVNQL